MAEQNVRWYLFGAQAAIIWGSPRLSADVDITATIDAIRLDEFVGAMKRHGFDLAPVDSDFVARTRVLPFVHRRTRIPLDIVLAGPGLEEDFLQRAIAVDVSTTLVPVISPEDLIITKTLAGRPKDIEDIRNVIHEQAGKIDEERVRVVLRLLEEALGRSDLLAIFEKLDEERERPADSKKPRKTKRKPKGK
jgi:hypothetical protein